MKAHVLLQWRIEERGGSFVLVNDYDDTEIWAIDYPGARYLQNALNKESRRPDGHEKA